MLVAVVGYRDAMKKLTPLQAQILLAALEVTPDALQETKQFTSRELAAFNLARSLKAEGRFTDAIKVLAQRGLVERLADMVSSILKVGNKMVISAAVGALPARPNGRSTTWAVVYNKKVKYFYGDVKDEKMIYRNEVKPYVLELIQDGADPEEIIVLDRHDLGIH